MLPALKMQYGNTGIPGKELNIQLPLGMLAGAVEQCAAITRADLAGIERSPGLCHNGGKSAHGFIAVEAVVEIE